MNMDLQIFSIFSIILFYAEAASADAHQCKGIRTRRHAQISKPPNISGSWFSPSCELLPGPQYLLRKYEFRRDASQFVITRYYYSDEFCKEVAYCIQGRGVITAQSPSWYLSEATEMSIELTELTVKPYTPEMSDRLSATISRSCAGNNEVENWNVTPFSVIQVNASDQNCLQALSFSINELLVMRQVDYYHDWNAEKTTTGAADVTSSTSPLSRERGRGRRMSVNPKETERELQLGNGVWFSQLDRPSSYQPPLYAVTHKHCVACDCIYRSDINNPPMRCHHGVSQTPRAVPVADVTGLWFSQNCESVPYSLFTLRSYVFNETDSTFNITTHYFTDAFCTRPSFVLRAEGELVVGAAHTRIYNTHSYKLVFKRLHVGILADFMLQLQNLGDASLCGDVSLWELGKMYDVTGTQGCSTLGVVISDSEYVLIKVEQPNIQSAFILISEMKSNESDFYTQVTHFSPKLKKCSSEPKRWTEHFTEVLTQTDSGCSKHQDATSVLSIVIILHFVSYALPHKLRL